VDGSPRGREALPLAGHRHEPHGHAIEVRLYAEDPNQDFQPCAGVLTEVVFPPGVRTDTWVERGSEVTAYYDPLLAKLIVAGRTRDEAVAGMSAALAATRLGGIETNLEYLRTVVRTDVFRAGTQTTRYLRDLPYAPATIDVREPGTHTTVQDHPGRLGYWAVGVPPSGPMDTLAFRLANRVVGKSLGRGGLECTVAGPTLRFNRAADVCLAGAAMAADLDGTPVAYWTPVAVPAGATLRLGTVEGGGLRTYVAIRGGLDVPDYLGSKSTFTLGRFGGHAGRCLRTGDVLHLADDRDPARLTEPTALTPELHPAYGDTWTIGAVYGPHGAPDFFTPADVRTLLSTDYEVHYNSSRTGVRLVGPKPKWARRDGGEAGLHPSNIHDNGYSVGTLDFTGDMPIILGPDGPSLGGFVCPLTIARAELWKVGQLRPGDTVRFVLVSLAEAAERLEAHEREIATLQPAVPAVTPCESSGGADVPASAVLRQLPAAPGRVEVVYRPCGDDALLVEYGPPVLDLTLPFFGARAQ
jgi:urea carboxylase